MKFSVKLCLALSPFLLTFSCKKKNTSETPTIANVTINTSLPGVATVNIFSVTAQSALCKANVSSEGSSALTAVGVCWDTVPGPTTLRFYSVFGVGTGTFNCMMYNLKPNTTYYVRAFAVNASGTAYGSEMKFTTIDAWSLIGLSNKTISAMIYSGNNLIAATTSGLYISTNEGVTWTPANSTALTTINNFAKNSSYLFACTNAGLYRSSDNGVNWSQVNIGVNDPYITAIATVGSIVYINTSYYGLRKSSDNGATWSAITQTGSGNDIVCLAFNGTDLYASSSYDGIYRSTDGGNTWGLDNFGLSSTSTITDITFSGSNVLAGSSPGAYISSGGSSWSQINTAPPGIYRFYTEGSNVYTAGYDAVFMSTNNGASFTQLSINLGNSINAVATDAQYIFAGGSYGVYRLHR